MDVILETVIILESSGYELYPVFYLQSDEISWLSFNFIFAKREVMVREGRSEDTVAEILGLPRLNVQLFLAQR